MRTTIRIMFAFSALLALMCSATAIQKQPRMMGEDEVFACQKFDLAANSASKCEKHGAMSKVNAKVFYSCKACKTTSAKHGNCPKCGKFMSKMARTYSCDKCHTTAKINIKCSKCGGKMTEHVMPFKS